MSFTVGFVSSSGLPRHHGTRQHGWYTSEPLRKHFPNLYFASWYGIATLEKSDKPCARLGYRPHSAPPAPAAVAREAAGATPPVGALEAVGRGWAWAAAGEAAPASCLDRRPRLRRQRRRLPPASDSTPPEAGSALPEVSIFRLKYVHIDHYILVYLLVKGQTGQRRQVERWREVPRRRVEARQTGEGKI